MEDFDPIIIVLVWPPSRFPLIHEARDILRKGGRSAFEEWRKSLSPLQRGELFGQFRKLLSLVSGKSELEIDLDIIGMINRRESI